MQEPTFQKAYDEFNQMSNDKEVRARALSSDIFLKKEKSPLEISGLLETPLPVVEDYLSL